MSSKHTYSLALQYYQKNKWKYHKRIPRKTNWINDVWCFPCFLIYFFLWRFYIFNISCSIGFFCCLHGTESYIGYILYESPLGKTVVEILHFFTSPVDVTRQQPRIKNAEESSERTTTTKSWRWLRADEKRLYYVFICPISEPFMLVYWNK